MTFEEKLAMLRVKFRQLAKAAVVGIRDNGEGNAGAPPLYLFSVRIPSGAVPGEKVLQASFALLRSEVESIDTDMVLALFESRWISMMLGIWHQVVKNHGT